MSTLPNQTKETWENISKITVILQKYDSRGNRNDEVVPPGRKVTLTTEDRLVNSDIAASPDLDPFLNGVLAPAGKLPEGAPGVEGIESNPNLMKDEDIQALFDLDTKDLKACLAEVTNPATLARVLEIAEKGENVKLAQLKAVKARVNEVTPKPLVGKLPPSRRKIEDDATS